MSAHFHEEDRFSTWLIQLRRTVLQALGASGRPRADHGDIASSIVADAFAAGPELMERYPIASVYASVRVGHAAESFYRRERAQRGEGSRLYRQQDGTLAPGRRVNSADASAFRDSTDGSSVYERATTEFGFEDDLVESIVGGETLRSILRACGGGVTSQDLDLFVLVKAYGHSVTELAEFHGVTRETMSRRISRVSKLIEANRSWFEPPV
jgi:DNA-directed RNA polymerase specialized sigma24 family protein